MAEFDAAGFSAVENFFGDSIDVATTPEAKPTTQRTTKRRGGVGSATAASDKRENFAKRVLQVGNKRGRLEDDDEEEAILEHGHEDGEEETGRTGIAPKEKKSAPQLEETIDTGKRKLGKKERKRLQEQQQANNDDDDVVVVEAQVGEDDKKGLEGATEKKEEPNNKRKQKRRKVRSRQKNIYKDQRSSEEKPGYLIPGGRATYQGRPLTEETRNKLNLPKVSKTQEFFVVDRSPIESNMDSGLKLGVEDLLGGEETKKKLPSKKKKKSKKKYKNL